MIVVWRIDKAKRSAEESFSGEGAFLYGGRWSHKGIRTVYASGSLSLAALEKFVHTGPEGQGLELVSYRVEIPDGVAIERLEVPVLPGDWREEPPPESTKNLGSAWAKEKRSAVLKVPSAVVPSEANYLLNPLQPDSRRLKVSAPEVFSFDPRMWK